MHFTSRVSNPVQRKDAVRYFRLNLLSFAVSVTFTRFFLMATGYPQLGNETFHIAHVLYGGVILYAGSLLPLIYANRWAYTLSSVLSGVGVGLFIDEVGKFITQSNDYFFPAAAPIIYAFFLISVLIYTRVVKGAPSDTRTEFYAVLESLEKVVDHDMDTEDHGELRSRLQRIRDQEADTDLGLLSNQILGFVESETIHVEDHEQGHVDKAAEWFGGIEGAWLSRGRLRAVVIMGMLLFGLAGSVRLAYYTSGGPTLLESLLLERISSLPAVTGVSLFWAKAQLVMEGLVGVSLLSSAALMVLGKERVGLGVGSVGMVVYLVGVNLIQFYIDQFATVVKSLIQFLFLQAVYYYQRRFLM